MKFIEMTAEQTARYDDDDLSVMDELRAEAERIRAGAETVEILTSDGIVADVVQD